jgi:hypothetical protein
MRRRSSLRGIALSYGSVLAGANHGSIVSGSSNDSATNRNARVLGRTALDIERAFRSLVFGKQPSAQAATPQGPGRRIWLGGAFR